MDQSASTGSKNSPRVILPNLGRRFSGVTSTLLQVLPRQLERISLVVWRDAFVEEGTPTVSFRELLRITKNPLSDGSNRVFHARRNIEMLWGLILKWIFRRPLKLVFTSTAQRAHSQYTKFLYRRMDAIITTSERAGSFLEKPADYIVPHGINISLYPFIEDKEKAWSEQKFPGSKGIGIFGRIRPQKGIDLFVDAMIEKLPYFPEYTAVIVGKTTPKFESFVQSLKKRIRSARLEGRFVWLGEVEYKALPSLYGAMSIVASVSRVEGFGLTCLEAMSSGAPVIASRTGGFDLVVRDEVDGMLVDCGSAAQIASSFEKLASVPDMLPKMSASARRRIEDSFTIEREADALIDIYEELANRHA